MKLERLKRISPRRGEHSVAQYETGGLETWRIVVRLTLPRRRPGVPLNISENVVPSEVIRKSE